MTSINCRPYVLRGSVVVLSLFLPVIGHSEVIQGQVTQVNSDSGTVTVAPADQDSYPRSLEIKVARDVLGKDRNIESLEELSVGEQIIVEADKGTQNGWQAQSIVTAESSQAQDAFQPASALQPETSMMNTVHGEVVSIDHQSKKIAVMDYASGRNRVFTVLDSATLNSVNPGDEVILQWNEVNGQDISGAGTPPLEGGDSSQKVLQSSGQIGDTLYYETGRIGADQAAPHSERISADSLPQAETTPGY